MTDTKHTDRSNLGQIEKKLDLSPVETEHTDSVKATQEEFRNKILDIETAVRLTYNEHDADQMIKKMLDFIATLQAQTSQQVEEAVLQADATGAYHSGYLAGKAEVEEAVRKMKARLYDVCETNAFLLNEEVEDMVVYLEDIPRIVELALTPNHQD